GRPMAERLLAAGHELTVYNRTREKAEALAASGASVAGSAREAIAAGEAVFLMLKDAAAIRDLQLEGELDGRTIVQMATIGPAESLALAREVQRRGGDYLEAPVLGSTPQAREGKLLVMVGGTPEQFGRWSEVLRVFGPEPVLVGSVGQAAALKLALNQLIGTLSATFALSLGMVRRQGIDVELFMDLLRKGTFYAPTFDRKLPGLLARDFSDPNFPAALMLKDLGLIQDHAAGLGLDTTVLESVRDVVRRTVEKGLGGADYSALYEVIDPE
ncbi:MAG: NAD(P)-dependent oxidoreductase, partial [Thermoanaerobaculia bacterium]